MRRLFLASLFVLSSVSAAYAGDLKPSPHMVDPKLYHQLPSDIPMGDANAPVTMIEYASLSCPHCAHFARTIFPDIQKAYIDTGKVKYIFRDFPLDGQALKAAVIAHCADKDRYYTFVKVIFDKQDAWDGQKNYLELLTNIAKLGGLSGDKINACLDNKAMEDEVIQSKLTASNSLDIKATPTFFINGEKIEGAGSADEFHSAIDKALAKK